MSPPAHSLYAQPWPEGEYRFFQLGFVVGDVLEAAARWAAVHGVGPFHVLPVIEQHVVLRGEPAGASIQIAVAQAGPVQIELIQQHCDRPSIYQDWSSDGSCAFHQVATVTPDYDGRKARFVDLGYEVTAESTGGQFRVAYVDTVADFGFYTEVVEHSPGLVAQLRAIAETCATWDGTDPVRLLTRDGYRVP
jgi:glyoxalase/bleomycin resistance protein/dioxygenase superfamily protein